MSVELRVVDDPARAAGELLAEAAVPGAQLALSGGTTVGRAYEAAARLQGRWRDVGVWFGDERIVPPHDERSNYRLVREKLVDALGSPPAVHRIRGEKPASEAAALYDAALEGVTLELALNGIGADGHTASLFPGAEALDEVERRALAVEPGLEPFVPRVTLTPPVFAALRPARLPRHGRGEGRRRAAGVRLRPEPGDAGEPRPRRARRSHCWTPPQPRFSTRVPDSSLTRL